MRHKKYIFICIFIGAIFIGALSRDVNCDNVYNIKKYGALGNGVNDDYYSILRVIKKIGERNGGTIYFPKGIYRISKEIPLIDNLKIIGDGEYSIIMPLDSSEYGVIGEAYPSKICEINHWTKIKRFNSEYDSEVAKYQSDISGGVENVEVSNVTLDGNCDRVNYNHLNNGFTDDAYQNIIRLDHVMKSKFHDISLSNSVMNALSVYDGSDNNLFYSVNIRSVGKSGILKMGNSSKFGIYIEFNNKNCIFSNVNIMNTQEYGILAKAASGKISNLYFRDIEIYNTGWDGLRIGDPSSDIGGIDDVRIFNILIENAGINSNTHPVGLRLQHDSKKNSIINGVTVEKAMVVNCQNGHGVVVSDNVNNIIFSDCSSNGSSLGYGYVINGTANNVNMRNCFASKNKMGNYIVDVLEKNVNNIKIQIKE